MTIEYKDSKRIVGLEADFMPTPESTATYQVTDTSGTQSLYQNFSQAIISAQKVGSGSVLVGKRVSKLELALSKSGSPTGTATAGVFNSSGELQYTFGTIDVSTLTGSAVWYTFNNTDSTHVFSANEYFGISYNTGGNSSNKISVYHDDASPPFDGTNSVWSRYNGSSWTDFTSVDNSFKLYLATDGSKPTNVQYNSLLIEKDTANRYWFTPQTVDTEEAFSFTTTDTVGALWGNRIYGMKLLSGHSGLNKYIKKAKTYHPTNPTGSRLTTGTLYHVILDSSGTEIARSAGVSASSVSNNSWAETTFSSPVKLLENYTVGMTISTGSGSSYLGIGINNNSSSPTNTTRYYKDQSGSASTATTETVLMVFDSDPATGLSIPATWTNPKDFQGVSGLKLRLDASLGITGSSTVSAWADQSFKGDNNFVQATSGSQPTLTASNSSFNNKPTIDFDGSNDNMTCTFPTALTGDCSVYIVTNGSAGTDSVYFQGVTSSTYPSITFATNQGGGTKNFIANQNASTSGSAVASSSAVNTSACIFRLNYELNGKFYKNGVEVSTSSNNMKGDIGVASLILGGYGGGFNHGNIKIAEFLLFDHVLSDADNTLIMTYLEDKYSL